MDAHLITDTLTDLDRGLLERDEPVRVLLLGALAGEHVLLVGPPGTAKSELARRLQRAFVGARYFERLLTRFSVPEELFGPLSLKALEQDRYERLTDGFLPTAQVAFLDEVFKANSAILNALLTLLNEREFDNGSGRARVPLISVVGATNDVPDDEALQAFYDRFLLRVPVGPVQDASFPALLALPARQPEVGARITTAALAQLREHALAVALPSDVLELLVAMRTWCAAHRVPVSDRRWRKLVGLLQVQAATRGHDAVQPWDLWLLPYALGHRPEQVEALGAWFLATVAQAQPLDLQWLTRAAEAFEKQLGIESAAQSVEGDDAAGKLALARAITGDAPGKGDNTMVRIVSDLALKRYSPVHVDARVAQVGEALARASAALQRAQLAGRTSIAAAEAQIWLPPSWRTRIATVHHTNEALATDLLEKLRAVHLGFSELPLDRSGDPGAMPVPVGVAD